MILSPHQSYVLSLFEDSIHTEILTGGGAYGGKSRILAYTLLKMCLKYPGTRWGLGRHELKRVKETTLITFLEVAKDQRVKLGTHFRMNMQDNFILFSNGSRILLMDLAYKPSDPNFEDLGSLELTGAAIDEASEVTKKVRDILSIRVGRWKNVEYGLLGKVFMSCNPHKGWLYSTYYKPWENGTLRSYQAFVPMLATDNPWLTPEYAAVLDRLDEVDKQRLKYGNWDYDSDPARLIDFNKIADLWTNTFVPPGEKFITADLAMQGSDQFTVFVWSGFRAEHVYAYPKSTGKSIENTIRELAAEHKVPRSNILYDADGLGSYLGSYLEGAVAYHNGGKPIERQVGVDAYKENYANLKTQTSFELAKKVQSGTIYVGPREYRDEISAELSWIKRDRLDKDGKLYLLPKEKVKAGLRRSPDFADAMHMRMFFALDRERVTHVTGAVSNDDLVGKVTSYHGHSYSDTNGSEIYIVRCVSQMALNTCI